MTRSSRDSTTDTAGTHPSTWDGVTASLPLLLSDGTNDYLYGPNDKVIEQISISGGTVTYLQQDRAGSTRLITSSSGAVVGTKSYDAYGNVVATTGTSTSPFGYAGEYTDPSGLVYLRARYYDPATGQLITRDPLVDETRTPYTYALDDPINRADPSGLVGGNGNPGQDPNIPTGEDLSENPSGKVTLDELDAWEGEPYIFQEERGGFRITGLRGSGTFLEPVDTRYGTTRISIDQHQAQELLQSDPAARRVTLRNGVRSQILANQPKTVDGDYIDQNTGEVLSKDGPFDIGHLRGLSWRATQRLARAEGWTRQQVIEFENDASRYSVEGVSSNRGHKYE